MMENPVMSASKKTRRDFIKSVGVGTASLVFSGCATRSLTSGHEKAAKQPNVILVLTDDQGYGDLACHGNQQIKTPYLDELYTQSVRLTDFHVDPCCSPTRAALLTGRYSTRVGVWHTIGGRSLLRQQEVTMADVFKAGGYRTGIFGKWHLGDNYPFRPQDRGFQETLVHGGGGGNAPDYWGNDYFDDTYYYNGKPKRYSGYCTDVFFDGAMSFIESNKDQPFFCYLATNTPHFPLNVPSKYSQPYLEADLPENRARLYGMITNIDDNISRLRDKLRELELEDDTILIFMTDNGGEMGRQFNNSFNAGMRGRKISVYEGGHRVPCFIRWPKGELQGGRDVDKLTTHMDILPTLIEMCNLPESRGIHFDGTSLAALLLSRSTSWPDRTCFVHNQRIDNPRKWKDYAVLTERWRMVGKELYDIRNDPGQKTDRAGEYPGVVEKLIQAYEEWWEDISEQFHEYCDIIIGSDRENPVCLTQHDLHGSGASWSQLQVMRGAVGKGFWVVEIERDGRYEFAFRRWPTEVNLPITSAAIPVKSHPDVQSFFPSGKAIEASEARLIISDVDISQPIPPDAVAVSFQVPLRAGKTHLQALFTNDMGESRVAYYVYVKRLS